MTDPSHFLFYSAGIRNGEVFLDKEESRHVFSVLRGSEGETIQVTDGAGFVYKCEIAQRLTDGARCVVLKTEAESRSLPAVRVCVGLPDKETFLELSQTLAALGAAEIIPLQCDFCQDQWWSAWEKQAQRITKKMIAGIKQAKSARLPHCLPPMFFDKAVNDYKSPIIIVADENGRDLVGIADACKAADTVSCFVGPPGGFSPEEISRLESAGAIFVSLSKNRLRTELAAVLLCGIIKAISLKT
jgi:16S rRNA (uracil1498-N3)-methyltransferase